MGQTVKSTNPKCQALFAQVFGEVESKAAANENVQHTRYLSSAEMRLLARAFDPFDQTQEIPVTELQSLSKQDCLHMEMRETVAHFLSGCTDLPTVIRECDHCLQSLKQIPFRMRHWRHRHHQRRFITHLRTKCLANLQAELYAGGQVSWQSEHLQTIQDRSFFL